MPEWNDLKQLRAFVQVAESGSISSAAKVLGISQPTLTRQLQALERVASLPLVRRDTHNMSLTEAGRTLLPDARRVLVLADRVKQRLRAERKFRELPQELKEWARQTRFLQYRGFSGEAIRSVLRGDAG